jgi:hypothetical protein
MTPGPTIDNALTNALDTIADFIRQVTGLEPTQPEIADALTRYFVMNEIKDPILMKRQGSNSI